MGEQTSATLQTEKLQPDMAVELGLTPEQVEKASEVNQRFAKASFQLAHAGGDERSTSARLAVLRQNRDRGLENVMSAEQFQRMLQIRIQRNDQDAVPAPLEVK